VDWRGGGWEGRWEGRGCVLVFGRRGGRGAKGRLLGASGGFMVFFSGKDILYIASSSYCTCMHGVLMQYYKRPLASGSAS
jgi:hypothetical protein